MICLQPLRFCPHFIDGDGPACNGGGAADTDVLPSFLLCRRPALWQLSIDLFLEMLSFVEGQGKRKMQKEVCKNLALLYLQLHDEKDSVAKVGIAFIWGRAVLLSWCPPNTKSIAAHGSISPCSCILPVEELRGMRALLLLGLRCHLICLAGLPESPPQCRIVPVLEAAGAPGADSAVLADQRVPGTHIPTLQDRVGTTLR